jgi:hypothetical protein
LNPPLLPSLASDSIHDLTATIHPPPASLVLQGSSSIVQLLL